MTTANPSDSNSKSETPFLGLAPYLRMSIAGTDLRPVAEELLAKAQQDMTDADLLMNLATVMLCLGQRDAGLTIQAQALTLKQVYHLRAAAQPAEFRVLMLAVPGDLSANMPLDCLLEGGDIDLDICYISPAAPLTTDLPDHNVLVIGISEADENRAVLSALEPVLAQWPRPVIDPPQHIPATGRTAASRLLQDVPGLLMPPTLHATRDALLEIAAGAVSLTEAFAGCDYPIILRPVGSHAGRGLARIARADDLKAYLDKVDAPEFFLSPFVDYRGDDGSYRKFRIALIDGQAYACHMAVSSDWMIHYVNAGMYEDAHKREEEAAFMEDFETFARRHRPALDAIGQRTRLGYLFIDAAETADGQLLVFEIDHAMVVHAMDPVELFPYKQPHMLKVRAAFRDYVARLSAANPAIS